MWIGTARRNALSRESLSSTPHAAPSVADNCLLLASTRRWHNQTCLEFITARYCPKSTVQSRDLTIKLPDCHYLASTILCHVSTRYQRATERRLLLKEMSLG